MTTDHMRGQVMLLQKISIARIAVVRTRPQVDALVIEARFGCLKRLFAAACFVYAISALRMFLGAQVSNPTVSAVKFQATFLATESTINIIVDMVVLHQMFLQYGPSIKSLLTFRTKVSVLACFDFLQVLVTETMFVQVCFAKKDIKDD